MSNADVFIERYKKLEAVVRESYGLENGDSVSHFLCGQKRFERHIEKIRCCQSTRNLLQHDAKVGGAYPVEPSDQLINFVSELTNIVLNRPRCQDVCVKVGETYSATLESSVSQIMAVMRERGYSCVPVLDKDGVVLGVFTDGSVFDYLVDQEIFELTESLTVGDLRGYLLVDGRDKERVLYVKRTMLVDDLLERSEGMFRKAERLKVAIVTSTGKREEPLLGIITPWDILKAV